MMTLQETLALIEETLGVYGRYIYTKMGVDHRTYSAWRTGRRKTARADLQQGFIKAVGIDYHATRRKGTIIIIDKEKFLKCCKKRPKPSLSSFEKSTFKLIGTEPVENGFRHHL